MVNRRFAITIACAFAAMAFASSLQAEANRTFVSTAGNDANVSSSCGPTTPCRTFAGALSVTNSGGELVVLSSGGYGAFSINQAITITAIGIDASITVTSGDGIDINTTGNVTITGLGIHGSGTAAYGINVTNVGFLRLYNVTAEAFLNFGVRFAPSGSGNLGIYDSHFIDSIEGVVINTTGNAQIKNTLANHDSIGFLVDAGNVAVEDSAAVGNSSYGFANFGGSLSLTGDEVVQNNFGIVSFGGSTQFAYCNIAQNLTAIFVSSGTVTGSNPGSSIVSGTISGTLGTAAMLK